MKKLLIAILGLLPCTAFASCGGENSSDTSNSTEVVEENAVLTLSEAIDAKLIKLFDNLVISENNPVIIDFNATWCGPCQRFAPIYDAVAERYNGQAIFLSIDTDEYPSVAEAYKISAIPTVVFLMPGGGELGRQTGLMSEEQFVDYVNQLIATSAGESDSL